MKTITYISLVFVIIISAVAAYFPYFIENLPATPQTTPQADAIVVLTGEAAIRFTSGFALLEKKSGQKLLISGLGGEKAVTAYYDADFLKEFSCCVMFDEKATNTVENAIETVKWANAHNFSRLIVVTSTYHMPRALIQLQRKSKTIEFISYPVTPIQVKLEQWWRYPGTFKLLLGEYIRFVLTLCGFV